MSSSVFDDPLLSALFAAPEIAAIWTPERSLAHMLAFERHYTDALEAAGLIPQDAAEAARRRLDAFQPDLEDLRAGQARDGVLVPALVRQIKDGLAAPAAIHAGATSQDVIDTALVLSLRETSGILARDAAAILSRLDELADRFGARALMGRTRMQAALPITAGDRIASWRRPLAATLDELDGIAARAFVLQFGGAVGTRHASGAAAPVIAGTLAAHLGLAAPDSAWHSDRTGIHGYASWLARLSGVLGKMGQDICLMAQTGGDEIGLAGGGGSSAMPHKSNPVKAELLVTLARYSAGLSGLVGQALIHEQERSGAAWMLEWMTVPQMTTVAGCATRTARQLLDEVISLGRAPDADG